MSAMWEIREGDALERLREMSDGSVDAVVTDPPYGLEFMGKDWDRLGGARIRQPSERDRGAGAAHNATTSLVTRNQPDAYVAGPRMQEWHEAWAREALRVLKPGGHLLAFGGTRTYHRLACAVEDAGFEIRDEVLSVFEATEAGRQFLASLTPEQIAALDKLGGGPLAWVYGQGFPKSLDVSKAIDKAAGAEREVVGSKLGRPGYSLVDGPSDGVAMEGNVDGSLRNAEAECSITAPATPEAKQWDGWGSALKPAHEPIVMARKPLAGTVAANVLGHGTGALNIAASRIPVGDRASYERNHSGDRGHSGTRSIEDRGSTDLRPGGGSAAADRWPANVVLDEEAAAELDRQSGKLVSGANPTRRGSDKFRMAYGDFAGQAECEPARGVDVGGASRFFYCAKASSAERQAGNTHPTVKPVELMRWLVRLVTPPGGLVLDPFTGSGTTGIAAMRDGFSFVGIEREAEYAAIARERIRGDAPLLNTPAEAAA